MSTLNPSRPPTASPRFKLRHELRRVSQLKQAAALAREWAASCAPSAALAASSGSRSPAHSSFCSQPSLHYAFGRAGQGSVRFPAISRLAPRWSFSTWESLLSGGRGIDKADLRVESFASAKSLTPRTIGQTGCFRASSTGRWGPRPRRSQTPRRQTRRSVPCEDWPRLCVESAA